MAKLKTDSPLSRRIVLSFLRFLDSVEPAAGVDYEGLEVAKQCLSEAFKIDPSSHASSSDSLVDIFSSGEAVDQSQRSVDLRHDVSSSDAPCTSSRQKVVHAKDADRSHLLAEDRTKEAHSFGKAKLQIYVARTLQKCQCASVGFSRSSGFLENPTWVQHQVKSQRNLASNYRFH